MKIHLRPLLVALACTLGLAAQVPPAGGEAWTFDCNANGIDDAVDIAIGSSSDADLDGVPDECQVAPGDFSD